MIITCGNFKYFQDNKPKNHKNLKNLIKKVYPNNYSWNIYHNKILVDNQEIYKQLKELKSLELVLLNEKPIVNQQYYLSFNKKNNYQIKPSLSFTSELKLKVEEQQQKEFLNTMEKQMIINELKLNIKKQNLDAECWKEEDEKRKFQRRQLSQTFSVKTLQNQSQEQQQNNLRQSIVLNERIEKQNELGKGSLGASLQYSDMTACEKKQRLDSIQIQSLSYFNIFSQFISKKIKIELLSNQTQQISVGFINPLSTQWPYNTYLIPVLGLENDQPIRVESLKHQQEGQVSIQLRVPYHQEKFYSFWQMAVLDRYHTVKFGQILQIKILNKSYRQNQFNHHSFGIIDQDL